MLELGSISVDPPVVLAPMAGVTNRAFRRLCRRHGGALLVGEMVNARGLVEGSRRSFELAAFDTDETTRSLQLYGTDPQIIGEAVRIVADRGADHVDLNFGCPVRKVTRHGGGAAIPARPRLLAAIVEAAVRAGNGIPITVKMRMGLDDTRLTHLDAGRAAADAGATWVALHARTAEQYYSGAARWGAIADLVAALAATGTPVLGNGDIWSARDARSMMDATGCAGVVVGRACLGRPWFFADLEAEFRGTPQPEPPDVGAVAATISEHAHLLAEHQTPHHAVLAIRKHVAWYLTGYPVGGAIRRRLVECASLDELDDRLGELDPSVQLPSAERNRPRGTHRGPHPITLPDGWMSRDATAAPAHADADLVLSGG
ncbi:MAG TPA: tRNA dihydrouridine synthase DusB [Acidimicrobiia bacterium]